MSGSRNSSISALAREIAPRQRVGRRDPDQQRQQHDGEHDLDGDEEHRTQLEFRSCRGTAARDNPDKVPDGGSDSQTLVVALYYAVFAAGVRAPQSVDAMAMIYMGVTLVWLLIALRFVNPTQLVSRVQEHPPATT